MIVGNIYVRVMASIYSIARLIITSIALVCFAQSASAYSCLGFASPEHAEEAYDLVVRAEVEWSTNFLNSEGELVSYLDIVGVSVPPAIAFRVTETLKGPEQDDFVMGDFSFQFSPFPGWMRINEEWILYLNEREGTLYLDVCNPSMLAVDYSAWIDATKDAPTCDEGDNGVRGAHFYVLDEDDHAWIEPPPPWNCQKPIADQ